MSRYSKKQSVSEETQQEALKIAKQTQRPGQNKEQTRLIALGVQKGIELYKKQQKSVARERDKLRKKALKQGQDVMESRPEKAPFFQRSAVPWFLLLLSWVGFLLFTLFLRDL
ncbi:MAG: DUF2956 domain-containing protein [Gammaproteobacteria bacterium]|nr:DUF2956 domain-containing protein [Gammaproteobacteria bacterium]